MHAITTFSYAEHFVWMAYIQTVLSIGKLIRIDAIGKIDISFL